MPTMLPELTSEIFGYLDVKGLGRARCVNTTWDMYACAILFKRVERLTNGAINQYDQFVSMLADAHSVIAGLGALHVLFPAYPAPPFLEIFTPDDEYHGVINFLMSREHFSPALPPTMRRKLPAAAAVDHDAEAASVPRWKPSDFVAPRAGNRGVREVAYLTKGTFAVFVVRTTVGLPTYALPAEWNSALANYIGAFDYQSAYPDLTAAGRALMDAGRDRAPAGVQTTVAAWRGHGWALSSDWQPWSASGRCNGVASVGCACARRYFGDRHCAGGVPLPVRSRVERMVAYEEPMETTFWWRGGGMCSADCHEGMDSMASGARVSLKPVLQGL
ncbi:hypothetical protein K466DRAFT_596203 [Polyporus arcularius HHB13444]|uniref:F-box domain-containing protein n=1 Tax=Polyporus arcularius HHB13444 TaxID=1314778 RepID=A0A5C3PRY5_9APHY|nr:hypothetical protein K466DRAFT_596203 [Polyporus arcularius HHB13444]